MDQDLHRSTLVRGPSSTGSPTAATSSRSAHPLPPCPDPLPWRCSASLSRWASAWLRRSGERTLRTDGCSSPLARSSPRSASPSSCRRSERLEQAIRRPTVSQVVGAFGIRRSCPVLPATVDLPSKLVSRGRGLIISSTSAPVSVVVAVRCSASRPPPWCCRAAQRCPRNRDRLREQRAGRRLRLFAATTCPPTGSAHARESRGVCLCGGPAPGGCSCRCRPRGEH